MPSIWTVAVAWKPCGECSNLILRKEFVSDFNIALINVNIACIHSTGSFNGKVPVMPVQELLEREPTARTEK